MTRAEERPPATLLFAYGLLCPNQANPVPILGHRPDRIRARLYDLGEYPGAVLDDSAEWIEGFVIEVALDGLAILDEFENVSLGEYRRIETVTETGLIVQCYEYLGCVVRRPRIRRWLGSVASASSPS